MGIFDRSLQKEGPIEKEIFQNRKKFFFQIQLTNSTHNKSLDSELGTHVSSDESIFFYTSVSHSILFFSII
jgi:hypothetical protein